MKTESENRAIHKMVTAFNSAAIYAGVENRMSYLEEEEEVLLDGRFYVRISLRMSSVDACYRDIIRGINRLIEQGKLY